MNDPVILARAELIREVCALVAREPGAYPGLELRVRALREAERMRAMRPQRPVASATPKDAA